MNAIETKALTRKFKSRTAVEHLDLSVRQGELLALLGTNGAGKTTAIRMLSGLLAPTSGDALLLGHSITGEPEEAKRLLNISPQETAVAPKLTVQENLEFIARLYGASKTDAARKAQAALDTFHISSRAKDRAQTLSGGLQRRLSIAMALMSDPKLLFLDEPTLGLDVRARRELWRFIETLKGRVTVILTTHYLEEAEALADHIAVLHAGRLRALGTAQELKQLAGTQDFEEAFLNLTGEEERPCA